MGTIKDRITAFVIQSQKLWYKYQQKWEQNIKIEVTKKIRGGINGSRMSLVTVSTMF